MDINDAILYNLNLKKNRLKSLRKKIIKKYGENINKQFFISSNEFLKIVKDENNNKFTYVNLENLGKSVSYNQVTNPMLAIYISKILNNDFDCLKQLIRINDDVIMGNEYLDEIYKNIEFSMFDTNESYRYDKCKIYEKKKIIGSNKIISID